MQAFLETKGAAGLKDGILARDFLKRPEISYQEVAQFIPAPEEALDPKVIEQVEIQIKYEGYIKKAMEKVEKLKRMEAKRIPENIDYQAINGLATEAKQKLISQMQVHIEVSLKRQSKQEYDPMLAHILASNFTEGLLEIARHYQSEKWAKDMLKLIARCYYKGVESL